MSGAGTLPFAALLPLGLFIGCAALLLLGQFRDRRAFASPRVITAVALLPAAFTLAVIAMAVAPLLWGSCHCIEHGHVGTHLCPLHPAFGAPLVLPAALVLSAWAGFVLPRIARALVSIGQTHRHAIRLRALPSVRVGSAEVRLVDAKAAVAFTVGFLRPVIAFDRTLFESLSESERVAVAEHEAAHARRGDGLTLGVLRIVEALCPIGMPRWIAAWRDAAERRCDQHAARALGDPLRVAEALVSVARLRTASPAQRSPMPSLAGAMGIAHAVDRSLERRVRALLDQEVSAAADRAPRSDLRPALVLCGALVLLGLFRPGDALHHTFSCFMGC